MRSCTLSSVNFMGTFDLWRHGLWCPPPRTLLGITWPCSPTLLAAPTGLGNEFPHPADALTEPGWR